MAFKIYFVMKFWDDFCWIGISIIKIMVYFHLNSLTAYSLSVHSNKPSSQSFTFYTNTNIKALAFIIL